MSSDFNLSSTQSSLSTALVNASLPPAVLYQVIDNIPDA